MENLGQQSFVSSNRTQYKLEEEKVKGPGFRTPGLPGSWSPVEKLSFLAELAGK